MVQYFPIVTGSLTVTGSVLVSGSITTNSTITATTLVVQTITSSISAITGSTNFGSLSSNTHTFTGSVNISSSLTVASGSTTPTLTVAGGLVGVGMNPVYKLDVGDAIRGLDVLAGGNTFAYDGTIRARNAANNTNVLLHSNGSSYFLGGNVGVGTSSPQHPLQVDYSDASTSFSSQTPGAIGIKNSNTTANNIALLSFKLAQADTVGAGIGMINVAQTISSTTAYGDLAFYTKPNGSSYILERVRITSAGTTQFASPTNGQIIYAGDTSKTGYIYQQWQNAGGSCYFGIERNTGGGLFNNTSAYALAFGTTNATDVSISSNGTERMRITSGGYVKQSYNGSYINTSGLYNEFTNNASGEPGIITTINGASIADATVYMASYETDHNNTTAQFFRGRGANTTRIRIYSNGNIQNTNGSYGTLSSDLRLKENINEANPKLNDILKLRVVNFNLIEDVTKKKQIGFIAQEFQEVFPSLVQIIDTREYDEDGNVIKGLEDSLSLNVGMEFAILVKAIQELNTKFEDYKATHP